MDKRAPKPLVLLASESVLAFATTTCDSKPCEYWRAPRTTPRKRLDMLQQGGIKSFTAGSFNRNSAVPKVEAANVHLDVFGRQLTASLYLLKRLAQGLESDQCNQNFFYTADLPLKWYTGYSAYEQTTFFFNTTRKWYSVECVDVGINSRHCRADEIPPSLCTSKLCK